MAIADIACAVLACVVVPAVAMAAAMPRLRRRIPAQRNYRGRDVVCVLGVAWLAWAAMVLVAWLVWVGFAAGAVPLWLDLLVRSLPLVAGACVLGMVDDWRGDRSSRGFRGHVGALRRGHLTTGMLKMLGIGLLSLGSAIALCLPLTGVADVLRLVCAVLVMALSANVVNLFDLRPLRASKVYVVGVVVAVVVACVVWAPVLPLAGVGWWQPLCLAVACLGPAVATWRFDAREQAMLGDAGANAMGALVGFVFAAVAPTWLVAVAAVVLLALNLLSEKVSFTQVIERTPWLRRLDMAFRSKR